MVSRERGVFLICVGSEILKGEILNSNVAFLGRILPENGLRLIGERSVPDDPGEIESAVQEAIQISDWVITTGGLGPTFDDITRDVLSNYFRYPLEFSKTHYQNLIRRMSKTGRLSQALRDGYHRQSFFPKNSVIIPNRLGSASGFLIESNGAKIISLPGVPREFETMITEEVLPRHLLRGKDSFKSFCLTAKAIGISEVDFLAKLGALPPGDQIQSGIYPELGEVRFTASAFNSDAGSGSRKILKNLKQSLERNLKEHLYTFDGGEAFEEVLGKLLRAKKKSVSVAESCTGGYASKLITNVPGSSDYFIGGVTAYSDQVKTDLLEVPQEKIAKRGAVSEEVAHALAANIRKIMDTSYGIGITGIAGPRGGTKTKPVGLVYIGLADSKNVNVRKFNFRGDRERIRHLAAKWALYLLWRKIKFGHF